jgi:hypothetical protein
MNPSLVILIVFSVFVVFMIIYTKRKKGIELRKNVGMLNELLSSNQINPRDKATIEGYVMGKSYHRKKFEAYVTEAKEIKRKMDAQALAAKQKLEARQNELTAKYGQDVMAKLMNHQTWIGMSKEQLLDSQGEPTKIETEILKTKTKETLIYGNKSSGDYFVVENGLVSKIVDR